MSALLSDLREVAAGLRISPLRAPIHSLVLWVIEATHHVPIIPRKQVRVYIKRDADATVAELLLNVFRLCALLNQE